MRALYKLREFDTLRVGAGSHRHDMAAPVGDVAGALRRGLRPRESARRTASVCDRRAERQSSQIDGGDVGAPQRSGGVSGLPALHHACTVERGVGVEAVACAGARTHRRADSRRDELSQARHSLGRRCTAVLRRARQGGELSDGGHGRAVDRGAGVAAGGHVVPGPRSGSRHASGREPGFPRRWCSNRNGSWR